jgi:type IV secretion system protein VirB10
MPEPIPNSPNQSQDEPELRRQEREPKGVLQKNLKPLLYLGAALLVIVAAIFSGTGRKTPAQGGANSHEPPQPMLQDSTDNNVQDLKNQVAAAQQKAAQQAANSLPSPDPSLAIGTPAQQAAASPYGPTGQPAPCVPGQPCPQQQFASMQQQLSPAAQEEQQLAAKDRELAYDARFASNLVYARQPDSQTRQPRAVPTEDIGTAGRVGSAGAYGAAPRQTASTLIAPRAPGEPHHSPDLLRSRYAPSHRDRCIALNAASPGCLQKADRVRSRGFSGRLQGISAVSSFRYIRRGLPDGRAGRQQDRKGQ